MNILKNQLNSPFTYLSFSLSCVCVWCMLCVGACTYMYA